MTDHSFSGDRPTRKGRLSLLIAVTTTLGACSDSAGPPNDLERIELPVRMHLVQSDQLDELRVSLTNDEVVELMAAVNEAWAQAGIVWTLERIVREGAQNESLFSSALADPAVSPVSVLGSVLTPDNVVPDIWNVFMIRDFGGSIGGVYLSTPKLVVSTEIDPLGQREIGGGMSRILAHELGHSLGLVHVLCAGQGNLMAAACPLGTRTFLDETQITAARLQASTGRPF